MMRDFLGDLTKQVQPQLDEATGARIERRRADAFDPFEESLRAFNERRGRAGNGGIFALFRPSQIA
jgi:hypothetical protein